MKAMQAPGKTKHSSNAGWAARKWWRLCFIALLLTNFSYASEQGTKNVLVMYSFANRTVSTSIEFLKSELRSHVTTPVNFYVEYLETQRFEDPAYDASVAETLRRAYGAQKFDLIMVAGYPALSFEIRHRDELFPGVPIVFMDVHAGRLAGQKMWPGVTGVTLNLDVGATVDLALLLHPDTSSVAVITNTSEFERYWLAAVRSELLQHKNIKEIDLVGLPPEQLARQGRHPLPPYDCLVSGCSLGVNPAASRSIRSRFKDRPSFAHVLYFSPRSVWTMVVSGERSSIRRNRREQRQPWVLECFLARSQRTSPL